MQHNDASVAISMPMPVKFLGEKTSQLLMTSSEATDKTLSKAARSAHDSNWIMQALDHIITMAYENVRSSARDVAAAAGFDVPATLLKCETTVPHNTPAAYVVAAPPMVPPDPYVQCPQLFYALCGKMHNDDDGCEDPELAEATYAAIQSLFQQNGK